MQKMLEKGPNEHWAGNGNPDLWGRKTVPPLSLLVVNLSATISRSSFLHTKHSQIFAEQQQEEDIWGIF
jgi:hypothetical protein